MSLLAAISLFAAGSSRADSSLCSGSDYSVCIQAGYSDHGYGEQSDWSTHSYWQMIAGHNCTNYVAYVEDRNGAPTPSYNLGDAYEWGTNAKAHGITVDDQPAVGAVAWWDKNSTLGPDGHVAYVESYDSTSITISEDSYSMGPFDWRTIDRKSSAWPTDFIHFDDQSGSPGPDDSSTPGIGINPNTGIATVLDQSVNNSIRAYWQLPVDGQWTGPLGVHGGDPDLAHSSVAVAVNPLTGLETAVAEGPLNSLYVYWQNSDRSWDGPLGIHGGDQKRAYSDPAIAFNPNTGLATVVAVGPKNSLYAYWQNADKSWTGPYGIDGGTPYIAYSRPAIAFNPNTGTATAVAQGPNNSLYYYFQNGVNGSWAGPYGIHSGAKDLAYSAPAVGINPSTGLGTTVFEGKDNTLVEYIQNSVNGTWRGQTIDSDAHAFSDPALAIKPSSGNATVVVQGPNNSLYAYWQHSDNTWSGPLGIAGGSPGIAFSDPAIAFNPNNDKATVVAVGPEHSLRAYWQLAPDGQWDGPLGLNGGKKDIAF
ncbi:MAG TPA: CHAP domain-containing protein [Candidatus Saccharimonadales bacterium]|nr:CHAP domain-containing protein [Candidatus Saccharimonadales bacterium]